MTTTAHGARHVYSGATRAPSPTTISRSDWYRELHPEMYANIPSSKPAVPDKPKRKPPPLPQMQPQPQDNSVAAPKLRASARAIKNYLAANGDHTTGQIAAALGLSHGAVYSCLWRGIDGVEEKGMNCPAKGAPSRLWGLVNNA